MKEAKMSGYKPPKGKVRNKSFAFFYSLSFNKIISNHNIIISIMIKLTVQEIPFPYDSERLEDGKSGSVEIPFGFNLGCPLAFCGSLCGDENEDLR